MALITDALREEAVLLIKDYDSRKGETAEDIPKEDLLKVVTWMSVAAYHKVSKGHRIDLYDEGDMPGAVYCKLSRMDLHTIAKPTLANYVFTIATNLLFDVIRKKKPQVLSEMQAKYIEDPGALLPFKEAAAVATVEAVIKTQRLPKGLDQALLNYVVDGVSLRDAAINDGLWKDTYYRQMRKANLASLRMFKGYRYSRKAMEIAPDPNQEPTISTFRDYVTQSAVTAPKSYPAPLMNLKFGPLSRRPMQTPGVGMQEHGLLGYLTEIGELADVVKKAHYRYKPFDRINGLEEIGDLYWYLGDWIRGYAWEVAYQVVFVTSTESYPGADFDKVRDVDSHERLQKEAAHLLRRYTNIITDNIGKGKQQILRETLAGIQSDVYKCMEDVDDAYRAVTCINYAITGKGSLLEFIQDPSLDTFCRAIVTLRWILALPGIDCTEEQMMTANILKLTRVRHPKGYSPESSNGRNVETERELLERILCPVKSQ